jgi:predicted nucleic acid-binding protein
MVLSASLFNQLLDHVPMIWLRRAERASKGFSYWTGVCLNTHLPAGARRFIARDMQRPCLL